MCLLILIKYLQVAVSTSHDIFNNSIGSERMLRVAEDVMPSEQSKIDKRKNI